MMMPDNSKLASCTTPCYYVTPAPCCRVSCHAADGLSLAADEAEGFFRVAQYGQVYTLQTRLNEMMLKVQL